MSEFTLSQAEITAVKTVYKASQDFTFFCKEILGYKYDKETGFKDFSPAHEELCTFITDEGSKNKLILNPRYSFKSQICTVASSLFDMVRNPNIRILIYSDNSTKAQGFLQDIKNHIEGTAPNSKFRHYFPEWEDDQKWNESQIIIGKRKSAYKEPNIDTGGIETSKIGMHYDKIIFDDIVSDINTTTKSQMDKVYDCYKKSLSLLKPGGHVVIVGTRWHYGDCYGRILAENKEVQDFKTFIKGAEELGTDGKLIYEGIGLDREFLDYQKSKQGSYIFSCNVGSAPIIMADFSSKSLENIKEGEEVVGWYKKDNNRSVLCKSKVLKVQSRIAETVKITMESGKTIRCTPDHNWWTSRCDNTHREYKPASVGSKLMWIIEPEIETLTPKGERDANWLGGLYDGEGDCCGALTLCQSHITNPDICKAIEERLDGLGIEYGSNIRQPSDTSLGKETTSYWICNLEEKRKFLLFCNPIKKYEIIDSMYKHGSRFIKNRDRVVSIEPYKEEKVYALQTETGNYIAWGYGSKNCLYLNNPVSDETSIFKIENFSYYTPHPEFHKNMFITCACDPAGEGEDFTAITVVGTDQVRNMYLLDAVNAHLKPNKITDEIIRLNYKWKFNRFAIEKNFFKGMLEDDLRRAIKEEEKNRVFKPFSVQEITATAKNRTFSRILALQPYQERGQIFFPGKDFNTLQRVYSDLGYQMIQFTIDGSKSPNDDLLCSLAMHLEIIVAGGTAQKVEPPPTSAAGIEREVIEGLRRKNRNIPMKFRTNYEPVFYRQ